jgi:tartrate dehydratase beta subunit/fumarate hydratase class I family protein
MRERRSGRERRTPSRISKQRSVERIKHDTAAVNANSLLTTLRRQGYEELPIEEIQDRLSKLRTALAEFIVSHRT